MGVSERAHRIPRHRAHSPVDTSLDGAGGVAATFLAGALLAYGVKRVRQVEAATFVSGLGSC